MTMFLEATGSPERPGMITYRLRHLSTGKSVQQTVSVPRVLPPDVSTIRHELVRMFSKTHGYDLMNK